MLPQKLNFPAVRHLAVLFERLGARAECAQPAAVFVGAAYE